MTAASSTVVIVEDEEDTRELLRELLEGHGYAVATAQDGLEALDVLRRTGPVCFVLLDLLMPRMDGFELLDAMAADRELRELPVVITTSAPDKVPRGRMSLPKPIDIDRLLTLVAASCTCP